MIAEEVFVPPPNTAKKAKSPVAAEKIAEQLLPHHGVHIYIYIYTQTYT